MHSLLEEYTTFILMTSECCEFVKIEAEQIDVIRFSNSVVRDNMMQINVKATAILRQGNRILELSFNALDKEHISALVKRAVIQLHHPDQAIPPMVAHKPFRHQHRERLPKRVFEDHDNSARLQSILTGIQQLSTDQLAFGANAYNLRYISVGHRGRGIKIGENRIYHLNVVIHGKDNASGNVSIASFSEFDSNHVESCFAKAIDRTVLDQHKENLAPGKYTVLLEPKAFSSLISNSVSKAVSAKNVLKGRSFLSQKMGRPLFSDQLTIVDDCNSPQTQNFAFDLEGTQRQKTALIENGVMKHVLTDLQTAKEMKIESTGHASGDELKGPAPSGLTVSKGIVANEALIQSTEEGLLISNFHYINNIDSKYQFLTGTTRGGTYRIKNGRIVSAVQNMRFTEDMIKVLNGIESLSSESETILTAYGSNHVPLAKINGFQLE
jgi:predicted Zn-dependent protease